MSPLVSFVAAPVSVVMVPFPVSVEVGTTPLFEVTAALLIVGIAVFVDVPEETVAVTVRSVFEVAMAGAVLGDAPPMVG